MVCFVKENKGKKGWKGVRKKRIYKKIDIILRVIEWGKEYNKDLIFWFRV